MEEAKAAAYYDELTRKGEGAARFKQGLGFSSPSGDSSAPSRGSALPSSSSFLSNFVKASSPVQASELGKQTQLESIQNKLKKKPSDRLPSSPPRVSERSSKEYIDKDKAGDKVRDREREYRRRNRSRSRERYRDRDRDKDRDRDRDRDRRRRRSMSRDRRSDRRGRSRSLSPRHRRKSERRSNEDVGKEKEKNELVDYSRLIDGYDKMVPAERVKARMKLQLDETADKDADKGMGSGWERFEFNKDAPLDDEEIEAVEDDAAIVKRIGQSFRFSAVEARREEEIKAAHDEAMFGAPAFPLSTTPSDTGLGMDNSESELNETDVASSLLNEKVVAKQQGSWRDRARKT